MMVFNVTVYPFTISKATILLKLINHIMTKIYKFIIFTSIVMFCEITKLVFIPIAMSSSSSIVSIKHLHCLCQAISIEEIKLVTTNFYQTK